MAVAPARIYGDEPDEFTLYCESREFSQPLRRQYAQKAIALPDGSFPIPDRDALRRAIRAVGRGTKNAKSAIRAHIRKRAKALGLTDMIPADWEGAAATAEAMAVLQPSDVDLDPDDDGDSDVSADRDTDHDNWDDTGKPLGSAPAANAGRTTPFDGEGTFPATRRAVSAEKPLQSFWTLGLEGIPQATILAEGSSDNGGRMRVRMPFYVGDTITRAPGFEKKVNYPAAILSEIVRKAKQQISEGRQPLTVYARHAHALSAEHLPIGALVDVEQQGRIGWATCEIEPTSTGKDVMTLARGRKLNASSLRSGPGRYLLEEKKVNGEDMYVVQSLTLDGLDFAPDGPAMDTFGIEVLAAEAHVEDPTPTGETITQEDNVGEKPLTAEVLKIQHADLVAEIETPLRAQIEALEAEKEALVQEKKRVELDAYVERVCRTLTQEQGDALRRYAQETGSRKAVMEKLTDVLLQAREQSPTAPAVPTLSVEDQLRAAFVPNTGAGHVPDTTPAPSVVAEDLNVEANLPLV